MKIKVIYQGKHWTERDGATAKEDEAAFPERNNYLTHRHFEDSRRS